jgi:hypothetical protein
MAMPVQVIQILSQMTRRSDRSSPNTTSEPADCHECKGQGEVMAFHPETGHEAVECPECLGSGYNTLGLILNQVLKPPQEGYGPVELRAVLESDPKPATNEAVIGVCMS